MFFSWPLSILCLMYLFCFNFYLSLSTRGEANKNAICSPWSLSRLTGEGEDGDSMFCSFWRESLCWVYIKLLISDLVWVNSPYRITLWPFANLLTGWVLDYTLFAASGENPNPGSDSKAAKTSSKSLDGFGY